MLLLIRISLFLILFNLCPVTQAKETTVECGGSFNSFLEKFSVFAIESGISPEIVKSSIDNSRFLDEIVDLDSDQSVFKLGFVDFSKKVISDFRVLEGRKKINEYRKSNKIWNISSNFTSRGH